MLHILPPKQCKLCYQKYGNACEKSDVPCCYLPGILVVFCSKYLGTCPSREFLACPQLRSPSGAAEVHGMAKCVSVRYRAGKFPLFMRSLVPLSGSAVFMVHCK